MRKLYVKKKEGTPTKLYVTVFVEGKIAYQSSTDCYFSYDAGYMQYKITIDWNTSNEVMNDLGLHAYYNTNFQRMQMERNALIIAGDNYRVQLRKE